MAGPRSNSPARLPTLPASTSPKDPRLPSPKKLGPGTVKITTTALNLRSGPGSLYKVIKVLKGNRVTMTGKTARGWAQLVNGKSTGWSSMQYLAGSTTGRPALIGNRGGNGRS